jgi:hypothetical protein
MEMTPEKIAREPACPWNLDVACATSGFLAPLSLSSRIQAVSPSGLFEQVGRVILPQNNTSPATPPADRAKSEEV